MSIQSKAEGLVSKSVKATAAAGEVRTWRKWFYDRLNHARDYGEFVSLGMVGTPQELLRVFGIWESLCENYGPLCAAKQVSGDFCALAEGEGYHTDLCSYARVGIGYLIEEKRVGTVPKDAPYGGMGQPDMVVTTTSSCVTRGKYAQAAARYLDVPFFCLDVQDLPWWRADAKELVERCIKHYHEQLKELVAFLERVTGRKYDEDEARRRLALWMKAHRLFHDACALKKCHPNPLPSQDNFAVCVPNLNFKATEECADFYQRLYDEVKYRADHGIGSTPDEKLRVLWLGLPPWFNLGIFNYLEQHGVAMLDFSYDPGDIPVDVDLDGDPLLQIAKKQYEGVWFFNSLYTRRHPTRRVVDFVKNHDVDGIITMLSPSCRVQVGKTFAAKQYENEVNVPTLILDVDMADSRNYSDAQLKSKLDAFLELLFARPRTGR